MKPNVAPTFNSYEISLFGIPLMVIDTVAEQAEHEKQVVDEFTYNNRKCIVVRIQCSGFFTYHNGYVECNEGFDGVIIGGEEITYRGNLEHIPIDDDSNCYIGFDTYHHYNEMHPETQTAEYVKSGCQVIACQLERRFLQYTFN